MRLGCLGCLGSILGLGLLVCLVGGTVWAWSGLYAAPPLLSPDPGKADPAALSRKLAEIGLRSSGRSIRTEPLVLGEAEVASLVSGHLADVDLRLALVAMRLRPDRVSAQGRLPLGALLQDSPMAWVGSVVPRSTLGTPIWLTLTGLVEVEAPSGPRRPRHAEARLLTARLGRIPVPSWLLSVMLGPRGASLLRWQVPGAVDRLEVGEGRITIRTR
jgi:hypothetical protein